MLLLWIRKKKKKRKVEISVKGNGIEGCEGKKGEGYDRSPNSLHEIHNFFVSHVQDM